MPPGGPQTRPPPPVASVQTPPLTPKKPIEITITQTSQSICWRPRSSISVITSIRKILSTNSQRAQTAVMSLIENAELTVIQANSSNSSSTPPLIGSGFLWRLKTKPTIVRMATICAKGSECAKP